MTPRTFRRLGRFLFAAILLLAFTPFASGGPLNSVAGTPPKIEEIEKAVEALGKGKMDEAYKLLQEAVKKNPTLPPARLMLARLFLSADQQQAQQQGRAIFELAAAENPDHPEIYLVNGLIIATADSRFTDIILNCRTALDLADSPRWTADQKNKFLTDAHQGLAAAYENRKDWANAQKQFAALLDMTPKNGQLRAKLAAALFFLDKPEDARAELVRAVKDDPMLNPPDVTIGRMWMMKGDLKKATEAMDRAVKAEAKNFRVHLAYADLMLQKNDFDAAKIHADIAANLEPKNTDVQKTLGMVARCKKNLTAAIQTFDDLLRVNPADPFASDQLALILADQSDKAQRGRGRQLAEINAKVNPRSPDAMATLGYVSYRMDSLDDASRYLSASLQLSGNQLKPDTAYYMALVFNDKEQFDKAKEVLEAALKAQGLFVYRKEAQELLDKVKKKVPDKTKASDKDKGKSGS